MRTTQYITSLIYIFISCPFFSMSADFTLENESISRTISTDHGRIHTVEIRNKLNGKKIIPQNVIEFQVRISEGTHRVGTDVILTSNDFEIEKEPQLSKNQLVFWLENKKNQLLIEVHYELDPKDFYIRKYLIIKPEKDLTIERIDVEVVELDDISQPYQMKQITARGAAEWRPGLGQPLYTTRSATFWGIEFPAAYNYVEGKQGYCGYQWGREVKAGNSYSTYKAVVGVSDDAGFIQEAFFDYIDEIRIRPLRLQIQYNSWFDQGAHVNKESFGKSVDMLYSELVEKRGVPPLKAHVIDAGWQDVKADWTEKTWKVNDKFDSDFSTTISNVTRVNSALGIWISPGCIFGVEPAAKRYKEQGFETLGNWMSMAGPKYMQLLEDRIIELTEGGISYFKLDGIFGHLNIREFELHGEKYGIPYMPQLNTEGFSPSDERLNDPKFDEIKTYYLVAGTERLMQIFKKQHKVNPNVYVVISNGAYLSPWWLMYIDAVWMINAGDAARGSSRTEELVYRDGVYYDTWKMEKTQYPIHSVFNHEPKKRKTGESEETFSQYLWMNLSRGTAFIELYIETAVLSEKDWDVLAEGLKWAHEVFPYFKKSKMHGGNPRELEIYGYTAWNKDGGYCSFHNPSDQEQTYRLKLDRELGLIPVKKSYRVSSPLINAQEFAGRSYRYGQKLEISLSPGEVKILDFR